MLRSRDGGGYAGTCYAVSAYAGNRESQHSPAYCAGSGTTVKTVKTVHLKPVREASVTRHSSDGHEKPLDYPGLHGTYKVGYN